MFDLDHIHPVAKGGKNVKNNLRILCHNCNNSKADAI
jgi:5-methylcytosine-specific restriction endonuclease McrA